MTFTADAEKIKPYRIEWRANFTTNFVRIAEIAEHPGSLKQYVQSQPGWKWTGQWRLISQHVVEATGIVRS